MIKCITVPRGVANIFLLDCADVGTFSERNEHRPDKLMIEMGEDSISHEMISNYMSVKSPISAKKGTSEIFPNSLFKAYFGALNG